MPYTIPSITEQENFRNTHTDEEFVEFLESFPPHVDEKVLHNLAQTSLSETEINATLRECLKQRGAVVYLNKRVLTSCSLIPGREEDVELVLTSNTLLTQRDIAGISLPS